MKYHAAPRVCQPTCVPAHVCASTGIPRAPRGERGIRLEGNARAGHPWPALPDARLTAYAIPWLRPPPDPPRSDSPSHPARDLSTYAVDPRLTAAVNLAGVTR